MEAEAPGTSIEAPEVSNDLYIDLRCLECISVVLYLLFDKLHILLQLDNTAGTERNSVVRGV